MIRNIIFSFLMFDLILALTILGVWYANSITPHTIHLGKTLLPVFHNISAQASLTSWKFGKLDEIGYLDYNKFGGILHSVFLLVDIFVYLYNGLLGVLNFLIECVNAFIVLINFGYIFINNLDVIAQAFSQL